MASAPSSPFQPPLVATLTAGILTYCGFMVAGVAALMVTDRFADLAGWTKYTALLAISASLFGGVSALVSLANAINQARRTENGALQTEIDSARLWSMRCGNISLYVLAGGAVAAMTVIGAFAFGAPKSQEVPDYLIEFGGHETNASVSQIGRVTCYVQLKGASEKLPARACVFVPVESSQHATKTPEVPAQILKKTRSPHKIFKRCMGST